MIALASSLILELVARLWKVCRDLCRILVVASHELVGEESPVVTR
jgi:hypothetical protein